MTVRRRAILAAAVAPLVATSGGADDFGLEPRVSSLEQRVSVLERAMLNTIRRQPRRRLPRRRGRPS